MENKKKIVITYGTFDLFHKGHLNVLKKARALGDELIVGLSTKKFNNLKAKEAHHSYWKRKKVLLKNEWVSKVIPEKNWEQKVHDIKKYNVSIFVMGDDWKGKFDFLKKEGVEVVYLPRTEGISSTQLREAKNNKK